MDINYNDKIKEYVMHCVVVSLNGSQASDIKKWNESGCLEAASECKQKCICWDQRD